MTAYLFWNHVGNFLAPAAFTAFFGVLLGRFFLGNAKKKSRNRFIFVRQFAIIFVVNALVMALGLWFFGYDGQILTYAGVVGATALGLWLLHQAWRA